jgi:hypothetical protein
MTSKRPSRRTEPLTDVVLAGLPGPRRAWVVLWALVALLRPIALNLVLGGWLPSGRATFEDLFVTQAVFAYVVLVTLLGSALLADDVGRLGPVLDHLGVDAGIGGTFRGLGSRLAPIMLTAVVVAIATPSTYLNYGLVAALVDLPLLAIMTLPIMTFVWVYLVVLTGVNRLGAATLALDAFPEDRWLGLGPVGSVAFTGLWLVFGAAIPALFASGRDVATFVLVAVIVVVTVGLFVLSLVRLHGQMHAARQRYVAQTRALVAEAYAPITADATLATLQDRAATLGAAQALADRAERILDWPIDERAVAFITVVVTGVVTSLLVRLVLAAAGI